MKPQDAAKVEKIRAQVAEAHTWVPVGRYQEAAVRFGACLDALVPLLGAEHPEVLELADDLLAVRSMSEVADFGRDMGFRWQDHGPPEPKDG